MRGFEIKHEGKSIGVLADGLEKAILQYACGRGLKVADIFLSDEDDELWRICHLIDKKGRKTPVMVEANRILKSLRCEEGGGKDEKV